MGFHFTIHMHSNLQSGSGGQLPWLGLEKVMGLTGSVIILVFIVSFSPAQGERNQMVSAKFTKPVNAMPMPTLESRLWAKNACRKLRESSELRVRATRAKAFSPLV